MASPFRLKTALPEETMRVHSCVSREGLSEAGDTMLTLPSEQRDLSAYDLLGKPATLTVALRDEALRYISGYVTRFAQRGFEGKHCVYEMQIRPWLWLLTRTSDCRIFQETSAGMVTGCDPKDLKRQLREHHQKNGLPESTRLRADPFGKNPPPKGTPMGSRQGGASD